MRINGLINGFIDALINGLINGLNGIINGLNNGILNWLINGKIDRTSYFVTKKSRPIKQLEKSKNLKLVKQTANYQFYKREIK